MNSRIEPTSYRVWDLPTRLFHWTLVILIALQWASAELRLLSMEWHARIGYAILALLLFRLAWGFVGSDNARFRSFLKGPSGTFAYMKRLVSRTPDHLPGHNPVGGLGVVALIISLLVQAVTGLFSSDDVFDGPLASSVTHDVVDAMTDIHEGNTNVLLALVAVHLIGVLWHLLLKKENLIGAMVSGRASLPADPGLQFAGIGRALVVFLLAAAIVYACVEWLPRWI